MTNDEVVTNLNRLAKLHTKGNDWNSLANGLRGMADTFEKMGAVYPECDVRVKLIIYSSRQ